MPPASRGKGTYVDSFIPLSHRALPAPSRQHGGRGCRGAGRKEMQRDNTVLAHSHIKSNSFIFTFVHPAGPEKGWLGRGLIERLVWQGLSGDIRWGRALCQGIPYLIFRSPAQQFSLLIRAGQGVAAAMTPHVERGIHWVGEVGRLQKKKNREVHMIRILRLLPLGDTFGCLGHTQPLDPAPEAPSMASSVPCQGQGQNQHPGGPPHRRALHLHTSCR